MRFLLIISGSLIFLGILPLPSWYYVLLEFVMIYVGGTISIEELDKGKGLTLWPVLFGAAVILFYFFTLPKIVCLILYTGLSTALMIRAFTYNYKNPTNDK